MRPCHPERSEAKSNCEAAPSESEGGISGEQKKPSQIPMRCIALRVRLRATPSAQDDARGDFFAYEQLFIVFRIYINFLKEFSG